MCAAFRSAVLAVALTVGTAAVAGPLAGCAAIERVEPKSPKQALAEAEILFTGAINTANALHMAGAITQAQAEALVPMFDKIASGLNTAHNLVTLGDLVGASQSIAATRVILDALVVQLGALQ